MKIAVLTSAAFAMALAAPGLARTAPSPAPVAASPVAQAQAQAQGRAAAAAVEAIPLIDAWLDSTQRAFKISSMSVGIVHGDHLVWARGYGFVDAARTIPATPATLYQLGSITKLFTAIAVMRAVEAGRLDLDEPITRYLPWAKFAPYAPGDPPVTLRAILSHAAGLPREAAPDYWTPPNFVFPSREAIRAGIAGRKLVMPPFDHLQYSNLGFTLAGEAVARVERRPYDEVIRTDILKPLGMDQAVLGYPGALVGKTMPVAFTAPDLDGVRKPVDIVDVRGLESAGGLSASVEDLARFAAWQFHLLRTGEGGILKRQTLQDMQRVHFMDPEWRTSWGLGFIVAHRDDQTFVGHDGELPGMRATLSMHLASETAVITMRSSSGPPGAVQPGVLGLLRARLEAQPIGTESAADLAPFAGRYSEQPWGAEGIFVPWAGGLAYLSLPSLDPGKSIARLRRISGDTFRRLRDDGTEAQEVRFVRDATGRITGVWQQDNIHPRIN